MDNVQETLDNARLKQEAEDMTSGQSTKISFEEKEYEPHLDDEGAVMKPPYSDDGAGADGSSYGSEGMSQNEITKEEFKDAFLDCREVFRAKLQDYNASWRILRPASVTDQLFIKASRIRNLQETGISYVGEGIYPEFQAIVNYGIIALLQLSCGASLTIDMTQEDALSYYDRYLSSAFDLMVKKNSDYHEAWRYMRVGSYVDFILVKLSRIKQIEDNGGKTIVSEGIESNYLDIINYAIFGLIKLTEEKDQRESD